MKLRRLFIVLLLIPASYCMAQTGKDSATEAGSAHFKMNKSKTFWMGANYRNEWKTPITVPILNLATEHGGLTPLKRGGGKQTKSLRVADPQGREYTLRSIKKFITSKTLPGDLQSEAAADLVSDGVSASYPYAALSIPVLAEAAGIPHGSARIVYIGDDPKLGEFKQDFANTMMLYEERLPDTVNKAYDTGEVADKLENDNDNDVDQVALLKIRILDMFIMDLDRHEDQWTWGAYERGKGKVFYPVAKDRDQAFYTNQGLLPGIVKWPWLVPQLEGFKAKAKNIDRFNFAARNLDRFFLNELSEDDWKQAVDKFLAQMTDAVIEKALNQQPKEIKDISAEKIVKTLKERRKYLADEVMEYYRFLSQAVDVTGSDKKELFDITKNSDGSVLLQVYKTTKEGDQSVKMYERKFDGNTTKEICLYGFGGDDKFVVHGTEDKIKLRVIGGGGEDLFENTAGKSGKAGIVYDATGKNNKLIGKWKNKMSSDTAVNSYERIYYKYNQTIPFVSIGFNQDDGLFLGGSLKFVRHGFRKVPYKTMHQLTVNHALATKAFNFHWYSEFIGAFSKNADLLFDADIKSPSTTTNFFGYGGISVYDKSKPGQFRYYRARYQLGDISLLLRTRFSDKITVTFGPTYQFYSLDSTDNKSKNILLTGTNGLDPATLYAKQSYAGGKLSIVADTRNNKILPQKGILFSAAIRHLEGLNNASYSVTQVNSELTLYFRVGKVAALVNRFGGGHNFGEFEFYQAQYLGMDDNLRGYRKYRFAGKSKLFNNIEFRTKIANFRTYLFPGAIGLMAFYDTGRVWDANNTSTKWLNGYGGGIWISPLSRIVLTVCYTASKEDKLPLIGFGWQF